MTGPSSERTAARCGMDGCEKPATQRVKSIIRTEHLCDQHARWLRMVESEWDRAEAEMLDQI